MNDDRADGVRARGLSEVERVVDVFVAPAATFRDILRSASWWLPFALTVVAMVGVTVAIQRQVGWDQVVETQIQMTPSMQSQMTSLTPEAQADRMHTMVLSYEYSAFAAPLIVLALSALAALVLWASFMFGLGSKASYGQILCLWMYCSLPRLLASVVTVATLYFGGSPESFNIKDPVGTNLAYYLPDAPAWLREFLGFGDAIGLWVLALLVVGSSIVAKVKPGQAAAVIVGWWLLIVIAAVSVTAAFS